VISRLMFTLTLLVVVCGLAYFIAIGLAQR
jgi:hypothetical protein